MGVRRLFSLPLVDYYNRKADSVGAHAAYSPIVPLDGQTMLEWAEAARAIYERHGFDLSCDYFMHERYAVFVCMLPFDKTDPAQRVAIDKVFHELFEEGTRRGFAKYRTHINHMGALAYPYLAPYFPPRAPLLLLTLYDLHSSGLG
ncbi:hypothetical protein SLS62_001085 [Diatrype stigma]|uniref:Uncharacterized protein n=1 Tax=Diatrype stigma TaxID=117547 RepID=A0AAN9YWD7_9PEZI